MSKRIPEHHRLYKQLKAHLIKWEDLTKEQIRMMEIYYPHLFESI